MIPEGKHERTRLPSILKLGPAQAILDEQAALHALRPSMGTSIPQVIESAVSGENGVLQLELTGGMCTLPRFVDNFVRVKGFSSIFEQVAAGEETAIGKAAFAFKMVDWLFGMTMPKCNLETSKMSAATLDAIEEFHNINTIALSHESGFGPHYFDGKRAATPELQEERGSLLLDGVNPLELQRSVSEVTGKGRMPSVYFADFQDSLSRPHAAQFYQLQYLSGQAHGNLHLDNVLQDGEDHAWVHGYKSGSVRHIFADLAAWLATGLFVHTPITTPNDQRHMKDLVMLLAAAPENLHLFLPAPPADGSEHVRLAWGITQRMVQHFASYGSTTLTQASRTPSKRSPSKSKREVESQALSLQGTPRINVGAQPGILQEQPRVNREVAGLPPARMDRPGLQMLWALMDQAIAAVVHAQSKPFPERKRFAVFAAVAFAHRLEVAPGKPHDRPKWMVDKAKQWKHEPLLPPSTIDTPGAYLRRFCAEQAWASDCVSDGKYTVLEDTVRLQSCGDDPCPQTFRELAELLEEKKRLVLVGGPGSGRSLAARAALAHNLQDQIMLGSPPRLPLRISMAQIAELTSHGVADPLQEHIARSCDPDFAFELSWGAVEGQAWAARSGHQLLATKECLVLFGGLARDGKHLGDVWTSRDGGQKWEQMPSPPWCNRQGHQAVVFDSGSGEIIIMAGGVDDNKRPLKDVWESRDAGRSWHELPLGKFSIRSDFKMVVLPLKINGGRTMNHIVIMGGADAQGKPLQDAWVSDNGGYSWKELEKPPWPGRCRHQAVLLKDRLFVMAGQGEHGNKLNDVWCLEGNEWPLKGVDSYGPYKWQELPHGPWTPRDGLQATTYMGRVAIFGGLDSDGHVADDAWSSPDGATWSELPHSQFCRVAERYRSQAVVWNGLHFIAGGLKKHGAPSSEVFGSRELLLVLDGVEEPNEGKELAIEYLDRVLASEPQHWLLMTLGKLGLDEATKGFLERWSMPRLDVQPFTEEEATSLCARRLGDLEDSQRQEIEEEVLSYRDLLSSPLIITMLLYELCHSGIDGLSRCDIYKLLFKRSLQRLEKMKICDVTEFESHKAAGLDAAAAELAFELQGRSRYQITETEIRQKHWSSQQDILRLLELTQKQKLVCMDVSEEHGLQFCHPSMQEYLAAVHLWKRMGTTAERGLPAWLLKEANSGNDFAVGCGRFFCGLAEGRNIVPVDRFHEVRANLGSVLRNMARVGDRFAVRGLLEVTPLRDRQLLLAGVDTNGNDQTALHLAALHGYHVVVRTLLEFAPDSETLQLAVDAFGHIPIHCAAMKGHEATVRTLVELTTQKGGVMSVIARTQEKLTALHLAARNGKEAVCRVLLTLAPSPAALNAAVDASGFTPLHFACKRGHREVACVLLEPQQYCEVLLKTKNRYHQRTALHLAAGDGHEPVVRVLLERSADKQVLLTMTDELGMTALHLAAEGGHGDTATVLLEQAPLPGELLAIREHLSGQTALHTATASGHTDAANAVRALLEYTPPNLITIKCGRHTALHLASEKGCVEAVVELLKQTKAEDKSGFLKEGEGFSGQTALHLAANNGHDMVVRALLENAPEPGALVTASDRPGGFTPLHLAAELGHEAVAKALLELAPDRTLLLSRKVTKWCGFTALHLAAYKGHEEVAKMMLNLSWDRVAALEAEDSKNRTPAQLAAERGLMEVSTMLANFPTLR